MFSVRDVNDIQSLS